MSGGIWRRTAVRALLAATGAATARAALAVAAQLTTRTAAPAEQAGAAGIPTPRWARSNYRGSTVNLAGGPALAAAATLSAAAGAGSARRAGAVLVAGLGAGAVGLYDDLVGGRPEQQAKGFAGHLAALRRGRVTSGMVKLAGVGAAAAAAAALLPPARPVTRPARVAEVLLGAAVVAGSANLLNLLDLRPGRALKVSVLAGSALAAGRGGAIAAGPVGAAVAALPDDLAEVTMLGDCGANALGAALGTALAARTGWRGRAAALAVIAGLTAASERISFTQVIARTPGLRELDQLGRRPERRPGGPASAPPPAA